MADNTSGTEKLMRLLAELDSALAREHVSQESRRALLAMQEGIRESLHIVEQARREWLDAMDAVPDPIFMHDQEYRILRANHAYAKRAGMDVREVVGKPYWQVFPRLTGPLAGCVHSLEHRQLQEEELKLSADEIYLIRYFPIVDEQNRYRYSLHLMQDVTAKRRAEAALQKSDAELRQAQRVAHLGSWALDPATGIINWSDEIFRVFGLQPRPAAPSYEELRQLLTPASFAQMDAAIGNTRQSGLPYRIDLELVWPDGTRHWVDARGEAVYDDAGKIVALRGTALDITERKQLEETKRQTLQRMQAQLQSISVMATSQALIAGQIEPFAREATQAVARVAGVERASVWLFNDDLSELRCIDLYEATPARHSAGVVLLHSQFENELRTIIDEKYVDADDPLTDPRTAGYVEGYLKPLRISSMLDVLIHVGGRPLGLLCFEHLDRPHHWERDEVAFAIQLANLLALSLINRDRLQAQQLLQVSEATLRAERDTAQRYLDVAGVMLLVLDAEGRIERINRMGCRLLGYREDELLGRSWFDGFLPEASNEDAREVFRQIVAGNAELTEFHENAILPRDGVERLIAWHNRPLTDDSGKIIGTLSSGEDITERKQAELALQRALRAQQTLSACNSILVHADHEQRLLVDMCRNVVEQGGYRLAWIGFVAHDAAKSVRPMASAGHDNGFVDALLLTWADTERGQGPTGRAIRGGKAEYVSDIAQDPSYAPWRQAALERGYGACISLPLKEEDGDVFGVLNLYDAASNAFEEGELRLLRELAEDLAFGILTLRTRQERTHFQTEHLKSANQLKATLLDTISAIARTVEKRDPYTAGHQNAVAQLAVAIAQELGLEAERIEGLKLGGLIHDIGKIYVPAEILNRPGQLSPPEFELIKSHSEVGYDIIKDVKFPWPVAQMVLQHHERLDGSGYPKGLKGEDIILEARILAVADVVEAITAHRPYRPAIGVEAALAEIESKRGLAYDADVVDACLRLFRERGWSITSSFSAQAQ